MAKGLAFLLLVAGAVTAFSLWSMTYTFYYGILPFDLKPMIPGALLKKEEEKKENKKNTIQRLDDMLLLLKDNKDNKDAIALINDLKTKVGADGLVLENNKKDNKKDGKGEKDDGKKKPKTNAEILTAVTLETAKRKSLSEVLMLKEKFMVDFYNTLAERKKKLDSDKKILDEKKKFVKEMTESVTKLQMQVDESEKKIFNIMDRMTEKEKDNVQALTDMIASLQPEEASKLILTYDDQMIARILLSMPKKSKAKLLSFIIKTGPEANITRMNKITDIILRKQGD